MELAQRHTLDAARRVQVFLDTHTSVIHNGARVPFRWKLDRAVDQLVACQIEQGTAAGLARQETRALASYRKDLYGRFGSPIRRVAESALRDVPEYPMLFLPSRASTHGSYQAMAMRLAAAAAKYEQVLINHMLPPDFNAQMRDLIDKITTTTESRARHMSRKAAATAGLETADRAARDVMDVLDRVLTPLLAPDPALVADWKSSRRIHKTVVTPRSTGVVPPSGALAGERMETADDSVDLAGGAITEFELSSVTSSRESNASGQTTARLLALTQAQGRTNVIGSPGPNLLPAVACRT